MENEHQEKTKFILESLENSLRKIDERLIWWWRITGLIVLGFLLLVGYVFCETSGQLIVLGFCGLILMCGWIIVDLIIKKKSIQDFNFSLEYQELVDLKLYISDLFLTEAIEIKARGGYSRDKLIEIKTLYEYLKTSEGKEKAESILKALDINLNDIQWAEGSKTGIRVMKD